MSVVIETTLGDITVDLFLKERPKSCLNFLKLCKLKYYNYNLFHTIEHGFIAQTGDPTGVGNDGGKSVWGLIEGEDKKFFEAESLPKIRHSEPGLISMVSTGENFIGSQFIFTLGADLVALDGVHCVIGEVTEGHEVLRQFNEAIVDDKHRPFKDIRITHTVVLEDPYGDPRGFRQPSRSPSPSAERLIGGRIAADEDIDDTEGKTEAEVQEMLQEREAKARATILEIVGDIPDADVAPPENVLFVCKLNPVTTDDDLQIIFSRFGKIKTCEVIRDKVSNDSLQYAFIEFEDQKSCEDAYFKMDNVLIDDRRIHVDFSQSVSKIKWRGKGNYTILDDSNKFKSVKIFREGSADPNALQRRSRSPRNNNNNNRNNNRGIGGAGGGGDWRRNRSPQRFQHNNRDNRMNNRGGRFEDRGRFRNSDYGDRGFNRNRNNNNNGGNNRGYDQRMRSPRRDRDREVRRSRSRSPRRDRVQISSTSRRRSRSRDRKNSRSRDRSLKDSRRNEDSRDSRRKDDLKPRKRKTSSPSSSSSESSQSDDKRKKKSSRKDKKKASKRSKHRSPSTSSDDSSRKKKKSRK